MIPNTRFKGWANDLDYLAEEKAREQRIERAIELHRRMREDELRPIALKWRLTIVVCAALLGAFIFWEAITWVIDAVLKAVGR